MNDPMTLITLTVVLVTAGGCVWALWRDAFSKPRPPGRLEGISDSEWDALYNALDIPMVRPAGGFGPDVYYLEEQDEDVVVTRTYARRKR
jgi:hypothetical protein